MMSRINKRSHSVDTLFSVFLFGLFLIFLVMLLLFCARAYEASVKGQETNGSLYTASTYVTAKFRRHDTGGSIKISDFGDSQALCMSDTIEGQEYITYIYLQDGNLKELFAQAQTEPFPEMGTVIAPLKSFVIEESSDRETQNTYYRITMEDRSENEASFLLHKDGPTG